MVKFSFVRIIHFFIQTNIPGYRKLAVFSCIFLYKLTFPAFCREVLDLSRISLDDIFMDKFYFLYQLLYFYRKFFLISSSLNCFAEYVWDLSICFLYKLCSAKYYFSCYRYLTCKSGSRWICY